MKTEDLHSDRRARVPGPKPGTGPRLIAAAALAAATAFSAAAEATPRAPEPEAAQALSGLIETLDDWLDRHSDYPGREDPPAIRFVDEAMAAQIDGMHGRHGARVRGLYDPSARTIFLVEPWSAEDPENVSTLLHELVHHRQAARSWRCPGAQEEDAYELQAAWLGAQGVEHDYPRLLVLMASSCASRDIHPD